MAIPLCSIPVLFIFTLVNFLFVNGINVVPNNNSDSVLLQEQETLNIIFDRKVFREIRIDAIQVINNRSDVILNCVSSTKRSGFFSWVYHGIMMKEAGLRFHQNMVWLSEFVSGPPLVRMECIDGYNPEVISNSKLIYRGDGLPPFLYNNGKTFPATIINESSIHLPCLLNYPFDNQSQFQLQLFKDGVEVENTTDLSIYTPELGFYLNLDKMKQPFGQYECRVSNSTDDDFVRMELQNVFKFKDDLLRREIQVQHSLRLTNFFKDDPQKRVFHCKAPKAKFQNKFEWIFLSKNGTYTRITTEESKIRPPGDNVNYVDSVKFNFPDNNISYVICSVYSKDTLAKYNNSYAVNIEEPIFPKILNNFSMEAIYYSKGMNLSCESTGNPIDFMWLKNGEPVVGLSTETWYNSQIRKSVLYLKPSVDDPDSNYTCVTENFLGKDEFNFRVKLGEPYDKYKTIQMLFKSLFNVSLSTRNIEKFVRAKQRKFTGAKPIKKLS